MAPRDAIDVRTQLQRLLPEGREAVVPARRILELLERSDATSLDARACARLNEFGVGTAPDPRHGGPVAGAWDDVVLFAYPEKGAASPDPSDGLLVGTAAVGLAVALTTADQRVEDSERNALERHLESRLDLDDAERRQLRAFMRWLTLRRPHPHPIIRSAESRLRAQSDDEKLELSRFLVSLAAADGHVHPDELQLLLRAHKAMGLPEHIMYEELETFRGVKREWEYVPTQGERPPRVKPLHARGRSRPPRAKYSDEKGAPDRRKVDALLELLFGAEPRKT